MKDRHLRLNQGRWLLLSVGLLLLYLFTRWQYPLLFPYFIDEVIHIEGAQGVYKLSPFIGAENGRLFGLWWWALFDVREISPAVIWLLRIVTPLWVLPAVAMLISLGRYFASRWAGLLAAGLYILMPFAFFHDRLVVTDIYVVTWALLAVWATVRYTHQPRWFDAVLCGIALIGALLAKATGIVLLAVPVLTLFFLGRRLSWRAIFSGGAVMYGLFAAFWLPFYLLLRARGYDFFGIATTVVGTSSTGGGFTRLVNNLVPFLELEMVYFSLPLLIGGVLLGLILCLLRGRLALYLWSIMLIPLGGLLFFGTKASPRYFFFHVAFLALLLAVAWEMLRRRWQWGAWIAAGGMALWAIFWALPFQHQYYHEAGNLALPALDRLEYIESDAAGFGLPETTAFLLAQQQALGEPFTVIGLFPNCTALLYYLPDDAPMTLQCPYLTWDNSATPTILQNVDALAATLPHGTLWIVQEDTVYTMLDGLQTPLTLQAQFVRPSGRTTINVWQVEN